MKLTKKQDTRSLKAMIGVNVMCMSAWPPCMYVHCVCVMSAEVRRGQCISGTVDGYEPPRGYQEVNLSVQKKQVLLATGPSPQSQVVVLFLNNYLPLKARTYSLH